MARKKSHGVLEEASTVEYLKQGITAYFSFSILRQKVGNILYYTSKNSLETQSEYKICITYFLLFQDEKLKSGNFFFWNFRA